DARHQLHGEAGDTALAEGAHLRRARIGLHEAHYHSARAQLCDLLERQWLHREHDICTLQHLARARRPGHTLVTGLGKAGTLTRAALDEHARAILHELVGHFGDQADARFSRRALAERTNGY